MSHIVWAAGEALTDPILDSQNVNADSSAAIASFVASSKVNGHARSYVMYFGRTGKKWNLEYYNLAWIE